MKKNANILLHMHTKESRSGITRTSVDGALGKLAKIVYIISFVYAIAIKIIYTLSICMQAQQVVDSVGKDNLTALQERQLSEVQNSVILVISLSVVMIAGFVLLLKKLYWPALFMSATPCVVLLVHFAQRMADTLAANGLACSYTYNHLVPLALIFISSLVYCIIGIRFNASENRAYTVFVNRLYSRYSDRFENLTDEEWEQFLSEYEPPKTGKLKRSQKAAARKEKKQEDQ